MTSVLYDLQDGKLRGCSLLNGNFHSTFTYLYNFFSSKLAYTGIHFCGYWCIFVELAYTEDEGFYLKPSN